MRARGRLAFVSLALASVLGLGLPAAAATKSSPAHKPAKAAAKGPKADPLPIRDVTAELIGWVMAAKDNEGLPFAVVDKFNAQVFVFDAGGKLLGQAPALVGFASGDDSTPGIGDREMSDISPEERTTPAGRFLAWYGPGPGKEKVLWVDYNTAISMHAVVTAHPEEKRLQRLRTPSASDNRITYGCINLPTAFYQQVVEKTFSAKGGVVYIMPDTKQLAAVFPVLQRQATQKATQAPGLAFGPEEKVVPASSRRVAAR
jgi:hypothetical protein